MIKLRHFFFLALVVFSLASCSKDIDEPIPEETQPDIAPQTLLVYFSGRGNLVSAFDQNIENMLKATDKNILRYSRILIFRQRDLTKATISEIRYNAHAGKSGRKVVKEYNEFLLSTDGPTMTGILKDMMALAPAEKYGLILGSHALGWIPTTSIAAAPGIRPVDSYWEKTGGEPLTRGFGLDNYQSMNIPVLAESLAATGHKFEYLIFDACLMSSIEALYDLRKVTDYIIASPCEVMLYGHPYDVSLPYLLTDGGKGYNLQGYCESFYNFYSTTTLTKQSGCIALTDCSEMDGLAEAMRRIQAAGLKNYDSETIQPYEGQSPHTFFDLGNFVEVSCSDPGLLSEFKTQFDKTFPPAGRFHTPEFYTDYGRIMMPITSYSGVSVSEPSPKYKNENQQTNWYKDTHQ